MEKLERLLKKFANQRDSRWWIGKRPEGRESHMGKIIAQQVAYPTATTDPFVRGGMTLLSRLQAAHVLAVAGSTSLAYGNQSPSKGPLEDATDALGELRGDATFMSNGLWEPRNSGGWTPLTTATFDCGAIGYDAESAFIFWVEEED